MKNNTNTKTAYSTWICTSCAICWRYN